MNNTIRLLSIVMSILLLACMTFIFTTSQFSYIKNDVIYADDTANRINLGIRRHGNLKTINCSNIESVSLTELIKDGSSKKVFLGYYGEEMVAIKVASNSSQQTKYCEQYMRSHHSGRWYLCIKMSAMKVMKEILMSQELQHANIIVNLGYCIRGDSLYASNVLKSYLDDYVVEISEYGKRVTKEEMATLSSSEQLSHAAAIASLLVYFENSPYGSVRYRDLKLSDFLFVGSRLKLSAINNIIVAEPYCDRNVTCSFDIDCTYERSSCVGYNARYNLWRIIGVLDKILSPENVPKDLEDMLYSDQTTTSELYKKISSLSKKADDLIK